jgi:hypothetical protein
MPPKKATRKSPRTPKKTRRETPDSPASEPESVDPRLLEDEDAVESEDDASVVEGPHAGVLALSKIREALAGLSQEDLQLLVKGTSTSRPLQVDDKAAASAALDLAVKDHLFDVLDDSTRKLYLSIESDPSNVDEYVWNRIFSGIRPSALELLPDISVYPHNPLLDWRPKKVTPDTLAAFRSRTKEATTDDVLFKIQDKPLSKLMRLVMPAFEMLSLPDLADQYQGGLDQEITAELSALKRLLQCFAIYTLNLHSDIAQTRRLASLTALGMTKDEVIGTQFLLDAHDMKLMKDTVAHRKEKAVLAGAAGLRRQPIKKQPWKKKGNRINRGRGGGQGGEDSQSRDRDRQDGDDGKEDADKGSKDGSSYKSTSTPKKAQKSFKRGKGK